MKSVDIDFKRTTSKTFYVVDSQFSDVSIVNTAQPIDAAGYEEASTTQLALPAIGSTVEGFELPYNQHLQTTKFPAMKVGSIYSSYDPSQSPFPVNRKLKYNLNCPEWFSYVDPGTYLAVDFAVRIPNEEVVECGFNTAADWVVSVNVSEVMDRAQSALTKYTSVDGDASSHWYVRLLGVTKPYVRGANLFIGLSLRSKGGTIAGSLTHFVTVGWAIAGFKLRSSSLLTPQVSTDSTGWEVVEAP